MIITSEDPRYVSLQVLMPQQYPFLLHYSSKQSAYRELSGKISFNSYYNNKWTKATEVALIYLSYQQKSIIYFHLSPP